jgi:hypothetical protein
LASSVKFVTVIRILARKRNIGIGRLSPTVIGIGTLLKILHRNIPTDNSKTLPIIGDTDVIGYRLLIAYHIRIGM